MINKATPDNKLDEAVKNALNNYNAVDAQPDWSRMESMLNDVPKTTSFKWSNSLTVIISVAVLAGGYFAYKGMHTSTPAPENKPAETITATPPVLKKEIVPTIIAPPPPAVSKENTTTIPATTTIDTKPIVKEEKKAATPVDNTFAEKKEKETKKKDKKETVKETTPEYDKTQKVVGMGNEPVFGDMLDSSKGIIGETKEKEETKKAAVSKKNTPVGWDNFMLKNVDPDSLRKYREKRDSTKVQ